MEGEVERATSCCLRCGARDVVFRVDDWSDEVSFTCPVCETAAMTSTREALARYRRHLSLSYAVVWIPAAFFVWTFVMMASMEWYDLLALMSEIEAYEALPIEQQRSSEAFMESREFSQKQFSAYLLSLISVCCISVATYVSWRLLSTIWLTCRADAMIPIEKKRLMVGEQQVDLTLVLFGRRRTSGEPVTGALSLASVASAGELSEVRPKGGLTASGE